MPMPMGNMPVGVQAQEMPMPMGNMPVGVQAQQMPQKMPEGSRSVGLRQQQTAEFGGTQEVLKHPEEQSTQEEQSTSAAPRRSKALRQPGGAVSSQEDQSQLQYVV